MFQLVTETDKAYLSNHHAVKHILQFYKHNKPFHGFVAVLGWYPPFLLNTVPIIVLLTHTPMTLVSKRLHWTSSR